MAWTTCWRGASARYPGRLPSWRRELLRGPGGKGKRPCEARPRRSMRPGGRSAPGRREQFSGGHGSFSVILLTNAFVSAIRLGAHRSGPGGRLCPGPYRSRRRRPPLPAELSVTFLPPPCHRRGRARPRCAGSASCRCSRWIPRSRPWCAAPEFGAPVRLDERRLRRGPAKAGITRSTAEECSVLRAASGRPRAPACPRRGSPGR